MSYINTVITDNAQFIESGQMSVNLLQGKIDATAEYTSWCHARSSGIAVGDFFRITGDSQIRVMRYVPPRDDSFTFKITLGVGQFTYEVPATTWVDGVIEWGDGTRNTGLTGALGAIQHTYATDNQDYYITVWNNCVNFSIPFGSTSERTKLTEIVSWGSATIGTSNLFQIHAQTFKNCTNVVFDSLLNSTAPDLVADISEAFSGCTSLTAENLTTWDFSPVTNASQLFYGCSTFVGNGVSGWDTSNVSNFSGMFDGCAALNISFASWDTSSATNMSNMFNACTIFDGDGVDSFVIPLVTNLSNFATSTAFTDANYDLLLVAWAAQSPSLQNGVTFNMNATTQYLESAARAILTGTHSWTITDGGIALVFTQWTMQALGGSNEVTDTTATYTLAATGVPLLIADAPAALTSFTNSVDYTNTAGGTPTKYHSGSFWAAGLPPSTKHFIECWLKYDAAGAFNSVVFVGTGSAFLGILLQGAFITGYIHRSDGGNEQVGGTTYSAGVWRHVGVVWDGSTNMRLYINGVNTHTNVVPTYNGIGAGGNIYFSRWITSTDFAYDGKLCNVRVAEYTGTFNTSMFILSN